MAGFEFNHDTSDISAVTGTVTIDGVAPGGGGGGGDTINVETLAADKTLTNADDVVQALDPNAASRNVDLPAEEADLRFVIINTGTEASDALTIRDDLGTTTFQVVAAGQSAEFISDGTNWFMVAAPAASTFASNAALSNVAVGNYARATSSGGGSTAIGGQAYASQDNAVAVGKSALALASGSVGVGQSADIRGSQSTGVGATVDDNSNAGAALLGYQAAATGANATSIGAVTSAGANAIGAGYQAVASGSSSVAIGNSADATQTGAIAIGDAAQATGTAGSIAIGDAAGASNSAAVSIGNNSDATQPEATAIGSNAQATGSRTVCIGAASNADYEGGVAIGNNASVPNAARGSIALGQYSAATRPNELCINIDAQLDLDFHRGSVGFSGQTTATSATEIYPGVFANAERMTIKANSILTFDAIVSGRDNTTGNCCAYRFTGAIKRDGANATALVGTPSKEVLGEDVAGFDCSVAADDTNEALTITVTAAATNITQWAADVRYVETKF